MSNLFIGIMSGTRRDSLDACLVDFTEKFEIIATET
jgi:Predicted molecular chaperone distantly related to HSP70-fold metalloproteases